MPVAPRRSYHPGRDRQYSAGSGDPRELTDREVDVTRELISCAPNGQIAEKPGVSLNTVKTHIRHLLEKTGFADRPELGIHASKSGIVVNDRERSDPGK